MEARDTEPNIPDWVIDRLTVVEPTLNRYFPLNSLAMGGGTILQARWNHRVSTDIDLFTSFTTFKSVIAESADALERDLYAISEIDNKRTWVEVSSIYCVVDGVELTIMSTNALLSEQSGNIVSGTAIETETTAAILNKKIVGRMLGGHVFEIRDVFDLYTAIAKDPESLSKAIQPVPQRSLDSISAMLQILPVDWLTDSQKPLIGVEVIPEQNTMIEEIIDIFDRSKSKANGIDR